MEKVDDDEMMMIIMRMMTVYAGNENHNPGARYDHDVG